MVRDNRTHMSALTEFLYPAPARRSARSIISWWEKRRLAYNAAVGAAGLVTVTVGSVVSLLPPASFTARFPLVAIFAFGALANVCYLLGPTAELVIEKIWGSKVFPTGPVLFRMGLTFSVGLALFPTLLILVGWVFSIVAAMV